VFVSVYLIARVCVYVHVCVSMCECGMRAWKHLFFLFFPFRESVRNSTPGEFVQEQSARNKVLSDLSHSLSFAPAYLMKEKKSRVMVLWNQSIIKREHAVAPSLSPPKIGIFPLAPAAKNKIGEEIVQGKYHSREREKVLSQS